jgi:hypothetical protein
MQHPYNHSCYCRVKSIDPDMRIAENTIEPDAEPGTRVDSRDRKMLAVPADACFREQTSYRFITHVPSRLRCSYRQKEDRPPVVWQIECSPRAVFKPRIDSRGPGYTCFGKNIGDGIIKILFCVGRMPEMEFPGPVEINLSTGVLPV